MKKYTLKYKELEIPFLNIAQRIQQESFLIMRICQGVVALKCKKFFLQKQKGSGFNLKRKIYSKTYQPATFVQITIKKSVAVE